MFRRLRQLSFLIGDILILYGSLFLALQIRYGENFSFSVFREHLPLFTFIYVIWILVFFIAGLYSLNAMWGFEKMVRGFVPAMAVNAGIAVFFFYFVPFFGLTPKTNFLVTLTIFTALFLLWRFVYGRVIRGVKNTIRIVLVGSSPSSLELVRKTVDYPELGYEVAAVFGLPKSQIPGWLKDSGIVVRQSLNGFREDMGGMGISSVVVSNELYPRVFSELYRMLPTEVAFYNLSTFWEEMDRSIPISEADEIWFLENLRGVRKRFYEITKRGVDLAWAAVLGFFSLLVFPFIALGIKLTDGGSIFYRQRRVGKGGRIFQVIKFRTMVPDAEKKGIQWAKKNDPRVTRFGRFLRNSRLDEIPQLLNVIRGEMSFIGPRPERPEFVEVLSQKIPHYGLRHLIRPGLTGWAQVNYPYGATEEDAQRKLRYDLYYLKNRSFILDAEIVLKTIRIMVSRKGM